MVFVFEYELNYLHLFNVKQNKTQVSDSSQIHSIYSRGLILLT